MEGPVRGALAVDGHVCGVSPSAVVGGGTEEPGRLLRVALAALDDVVAASGKLHGDAIRLTTAERNDLLDAIVRGASIAAAQIRTALGEPSEDGTIDLRWDEERT